MRIVMLGCGTGVGKTHVSRSLLEALVRLEAPCLGLKPIETGIPDNASETPPMGTDAGTLARAANLRTRAKHPLYAFADPISPHLAARREAVEIDLREVARWVASTEAEVALSLSSHRAPYVVVESAGGVFSPVSVGTTNFDLALALDPAIWVLVAPDALGVLHDVTATLAAMRSRGRAPDYVVLSAAREPDASTGTNAGELATLGIAEPIAVLGRNDDGGIEPLARALLARAQ